MYNVAMCSVTPFYKMLLKNAELCFMWSERFITISKKMTHLKLWLACNDSKENYNFMNTYHESQTYQLIWNAIKFSANELMKDFVT